MAYTEGSFTVSVTDIMTTSFTVYYAKTDKQVTLRAGSAFASVTAGFNKSTMTAQIPATLRPSTADFYFPVLIQDNSAALQWGSGLIKTTGDLVIYRNPTLVGTNWTAATGGWYQWATSYSIA